MYRGEVAGDACSLFRLNDFDPAQIRHTHNGNRYAAILESKFEDSLLALGGTCLAYSFDGGWSWDAAKNNLPKTRMMAGTVREADWSCFLATHGAGVFKRSL
jgi:hypothetical protein